MKKLDERAGGVKVGWGRALGAGVLLVYAAGLCLAGLSLAQAAEPSGRPDAGATTPSPAGKSNGNGQGAPAAPTPAPSAAAPASSAATLDRLRAEHAAVKDALFRSRARRETLENALLSTQLGAVLTWEGGKRHALKAAELRLDGVRLWDAGEAPVGDKPVTLAPRGVPPGTHVLGIRVEVRARDNPKLGYVSEQSFTLVLSENKKTTVEITIDEDGSLPGYNPNIEIDIDEEKLQARR